MRKHYQRRIILNFSVLGITVVVMFGFPLRTFLQGPVTAGDQLPSRPWMDKAMSPHRRDVQFPALPNSL